LTFENGNTVPQCHIYQFYILRSGAAYDVTVERLPGMTGGAGLPMRVDIEPVRGIVAELPGFMGNFIVPPIAPGSSIAVVDGAPFAAHFSTVNPGYFLAASGGNLVLDEIIPSEFIINGAIAIGGAMPVHVGFYIPPTGAGWGDDLELLDVEIQIDGILLPGHMDAGGNLYLDDDTGLLPGENQDIIITLYDGSFLADTWAGDIDLLDANAIAPDELIITAIRLLHDSGVDWVEVDIAGALSENHSYVLFGADELFGQSDSVNNWEIMDATPGAATVFSPAQNSDGEFTFRFKKPYSNSFFVHARRVMRR